MVDTVYLAAIIVLMGLAVGLMVRNEVRASRRANNQWMRALREEMISLYFLQVTQAEERERIQAREARERLRGRDENGVEAQYRIDVQRVIDDSEMYALERRSLDRLIDNSDPPVDDPYPDEPKRGRWL